MEQHIINVAGSIFLLSKVDRGVGVTKIVKYRVQISNDVSEEGGLSLS